MADFFFFNECVVAECCDLHDGLRMAHELVPSIMQRSWWTFFEVMVTRTLYSGYFELREVDAGLPRGQGGGALCFGRLMGLRILWLGWCGNSKIGKLLSVF